MTLLLIPLFKIPIIVSAVGLVHQAFSPPNAPVFDDGEHTGFVERTLLLRIAFGTRLQKALTTAVGLGEITTSLALAFPHLIPPRLLAYIPTRSSALIPFALGAGLIIAGSLLRKWCFATMGKMFTFELKVQQQHSLVTSGPYAYVRHPSYTGLFMIFAGMAVWQSAPGSVVRESGILDSVVGKLVVGSAALWNVAMAAAFIVRVPTEDRMLKRHFGEQWDQWAERVRYRLIPYVW